MGGGRYPLRDLGEIAHSLGRQVHVFGDLLGRWLTAQFLFEFLGHLIELAPALAVCLYDGAALAQPLQQGTGLVDVESGVLRHLPRRRWVPQFHQR